MLFSVTQEDRARRSAQIREFFKVQPALAYLMAAFDFEWTVRRAIVLMGTCPTSVLHERFKNRKYAGWKNYQHCWNKMVLGFRADIFETLDEIVLGRHETQEEKEKDSSPIGLAMKLRHRLVHGLSGSIPVEDADRGFDALLNGSERLSEYVDHHAEKPMHSRVARTIARCRTCSKYRRECQCQHERDAIRRRTKKANTRIRPLR